ncbi:MAG: cyclic peptide export ABC transporter, partial [Nitrosospira sp.]
MTVFHGACSVFLVAQISSALTATEPEVGSRALLFAITAVGVMLTYVIAAILFERLGQRAHAELRSFISRRVLAADYRQLERVGPA